MFFKNVPGKLDLEPFNIYHIIPLFVLLSLVVLIILFRRKLADEKMDSRIRTTAFSIAFLLEAGFHISNLAFHTDFVIRLIPLDLCAISLWLAFIVALSKSKTVFEILYFWGIGAIASLVYPDITGIGPDKMRYYHYFGVHSFIVLTIIYFIVVHRYRINFRSLLKAVCILLPITIVVRAIDLNFYDAYKTNWMFLVAPPDVSTVLDLLPRGGWLYYLCFVAIGLLVFLIFYLPWKLFRGRIIAEKGIDQYGAA